MKFRQGQQRLRTIQGQIHGEAVTKYDWKPFDTAPKTGVPILACENWGSEKFGRVPGCSCVVIYWGDINAADSEYGTMPHEANWLWLMSDGHNDPIHYRGWTRLTHWMELPDAPGWLSCRTRC